MASTTQTRERKALDHSHHLSELSNRRTVSPLKGLFKYMQKPGIIALAGGLPAPDYFPFHSISAEALVQDSFALDAVFDESASTSWFWKLFGASSKKEEKTTNFSIPKFPTAMGQVNLATSLQYGSATGIFQFQVFCKEFSTRIFQPAYDDFATLVHTGNTDAWTRCVLTLMNPGEGFLTEEWTYPSAVASAMPYNIHAVSVPIDALGMRPQDLRKILAEWDEEARGMKRPHVMYTVPVGQNPSGVNVPALRKKEIYDICVEYDIILVEDDPYYFQQFDAYDPQASRKTSSSASQYDAQRYLSTLIPSYLKFDYQGRVIRLDTFSKTVAPGSRLGWFTCSPLFAERLERQGETTTQSPCGFGQSLVTQLLLTWKFDGYVRWLHGINQQYEARRDCFIRAVADSFELHEAATPAVGAWRGCRVLAAHAKIQRKPNDEKRVFGRTRYFSFVPPAAGMFVWLKMHFDVHPAFVRGEEDGQTLEMKFWIKLAEAGVLFSPGWFFAAGENGDEARGEGHFRIAFSSVSAEQMKKAVKIFADVLHEFFEGSA